MLTDVNINGRKMNLVSQLASPSEVLGVHLTVIQLSLFMLADISIDLRAS